MEDNNNKQHDPEGNLSQQETGLRLPGTSSLCEGTRIGLLVPDTKKNLICLYHKAYKVIRIRTNGTVVLKEVRKLKEVRHDA